MGLNLLRMDLKKPKKLIFPFCFQELEQEKYHLRRRLEIAEEEFDQRVNELQTDVTKLRSTLTENVNSQRQAEKEKSILIQTLTEQNQRLTQQLKEVSPS